jgi:hypothetical protein
MIIMNEILDSNLSVTEIGSDNNNVIGVPGEYLPIDYYYLGRPPLLSEYLPDHPKKLLKEVFTSLSKWDTLKGLLSEWLSLMGVFEPVLKVDNKPVIYQNGFYKELSELIQALYGFHRNTRDVADVHGFRQLIVRFCLQFPQFYAQRELWGFVNAAVVLSAENQLQHEPDKVLEWYEQVSCLVDAAYLLSNEFAADLVQ